LDGKRQTETERKPRVEERGRRRRNANRPRTLLAANSRCAVLRSSLLRNSCPNRRSCAPISAYCGRGLGVHAVLVATGARGCELRARKVRRVRMADRVSWNAPQVKRRASGAPAPHPAGSQRSPSASHPPQPKARPASATVAPPRDPHVAGVRSLLSQAARQPSWLWLRLPLLRQALQSF
jgi:hypothetical protein